MVWELVIYLLVLAVIALLGIFGASYFLDGRYEKEAETQRSGKNQRS
jgi:flagellar basal body-associated protein FliL